MNKRKRTLVKRELQLRMVMNCAAVVGLAILVQSILLAVMLSRVATTLPNDGLLVHDAMPGVVVTGMLVSLALLAPFVFALGLRYSHRIAGPVYRMEQVLREVLHTSESEPLRLRKGDELQELAGLIEQVLVRLPGHAVESASASEEQPMAREAA